MKCPAFLLTLLLLPSIGVSASLDHVQIGDVKYSIKGEKVVEESTEKTTKEIPGSLAPMSLAKFNDQLVVLNANGVFVLDSSNGSAKWGRLSDEGFWYMANPYIAIGATEDGIAAISKRKGGVLWVMIASKKNLKITAAEPTAYKKNSIFSRLIAVGEEVVDGKNVQLEFQATDFATGDLKEFGTDPATGEVTVVKTSGGSVTLKSIFQSLKKAEATTSSIEAVESASLDQ